MNTVDIEYVDGTEPSSMTRVVDVVARDGCLMVLWEGETLVIPLVRIKSALVTKNS